MADTEASELQDRTREVSARKVIVSEFVTLDGVMEDPSWTAPFTGQEQEQNKFDELSAADALLLGRTTYEEFAAAWPNMMDQYEGPRRADTDGGRRRRGSDQVEAAVRKGHPSLRQRRATVPPSPSTGWAMDRRSSWWAGSSATGL